MSFQEKQAIASVFSTVLASIVYFRDVFNRLVEGGPSLANDLRFWGTVFLIYIPVFIVFNIVIHIIVSILNTVATREEEPAVTDELDRMVGFRADRNFFFVFTAGFMLSMLTLALGQPVYVMFIVMLFAILTAGVTEGVSQFILYRRGF